jgi:transposase
MRPSGTPRAGVKIRLVARRRRRCLLSPDSSLRGGAAAWALHCCVEHASTPAFLPVGSPGDLPACEHDEVEVIDIEKTHEAVDLVERVCALDIGKAALTVCIRVPHEDKPGHRRQEVREHATTTRSLLDLAARLHAAEGTLVAMKATSDYWKPAFYLLEAEGFTRWLLNARHVKSVPGRPKTDKLDAVWLAKVVERGMCRPSFVPPAPIRRLRDLTRNRRTLIRERTREKQRVEKLLEDAQIKLSSVASDIFGVSGRQMLQAMIAGQRDPKVFAHMARASMRAKLRQLEEALTGHFHDHHGFLCQRMLERINDLSAKIQELTARINEQSLDGSGRVQPEGLRPTRNRKVVGSNPTAGSISAAQWPSSKTSTFGWIRRWQPERLN